MTKSEPSTGETMIGGLLRASHTMPPEEIPAAVTEHAAACDFTDVVILLADLDQRALVPFGRDDLEPLDIDTTAHGRVFRRIEPIFGVGGDAAAAATLPGERCRFLMPLLDGAERLGVVELSAPDAQELTRDRAHHLATMISELIVTKSGYGDVIANTRRRRELSLAAEMRWALTPPQTFSGRGVHVSGMLEPAHEIAGDAFDYAVNGGTLHIAIFDAMGHGLQASRLANLAILSYRNSRRRGLGLMDTYREMDVVVAEQFGGDVFVTAQLAELDLDTGTIRWLNAGHPHPLLVRNGSTVSELESVVCVPVGIGLREADVGEIALEPGDHLLFYTDGVTEARAPDGEEFGCDRLNDLLLRAIAAQEPVPETVRRLVHQVLEHQKHHLDDDATVLLLEWHGSART